MLVLVFFGLFTFWYRIVYAYEYIETKVHSRCYLGVGSVLSHSRVRAKVTVYVCRTGSVEIVFCVDLQMMQGFD